MLAAASASLLALRKIADAQEAVAPPRRRYKVLMNPQGYGVHAGGTVHIRDLSIDSDTEYTVYHVPGGEVYGRGTYKFDGKYVRFLTGPFYEMGYWGTSTSSPDGHIIRLGATVHALGGK